MAKVEEYRRELRQQSNWDDYLRSQSGLPGPRGNLELAQAVVEEGNQALFEKYISYTPDKAPENTPEVFLAFCGVVGLGRLVTEGKRGCLARLREFASDPRWRIREAVAMALQRIGDSYMEYLLGEMEQWSKGAPLEQRAAAAGLCEPRLLKEAKDARRVLDILDTITASISSRRERKGDDFIALRKGLAYCWSVAAAACLAYGKALMEKWIASQDKDIRWIMKENLKKNRLLRLDEKWALEMTGRLG